MFGSCVFFARLKLIGGCTSIYLLRKNILTYFGGVEFRILVGMWNIYEAHIFTRSLGQKCCLEKSTLCLRTRFRLKKFFHILNISIEISTTLWLLCAQPLISSIIFHTRGPNTQDNINYVLDLYVPMLFIFRILKCLKAHFSHLSISLYLLCTNDYRVFGGQ